MYFLNRCQCGLTARSVCDFDFGVHITTCREGFLVKVCFNHELLFAVLFHHERYPVPTLF